MKSVLVKGMMVFGSIAGIGCVVAFPISSSSSKNQTISQILQTSGGAAQSPCNLYDRWKQETPLLRQEVDFERLGIEINNKLNNQESCQELSGKEDLKSIFKSTLEESQFQWSVNDEHGNEGCSGSSVCGYLELQATEVKKPQAFKIRILKQSEKGQVLVVKLFQGNSLSYKQKGVHGGTQAQGVTGDGLSSPKNGASGSDGSKISGISIETHF